MIRKQLIALAAFATLAAAGTAARADDITMVDDTLLSAGPSSILSLDRCEYDPTTSKGRFDTSLKTGSLAVVSGRLDAATMRDVLASMRVTFDEYGQRLVARNDDNDVLEDRELAEEQREALQWARSAWRSTEAV